MLISIDICFVNIAVCVFEMKSGIPKIYHWDLVETYHPEICNYCKNPAKFKYGDYSLCGLHRNKKPYILNCTGLGKKCSYCKNDAIKYIKNKKNYCNKHIAKINTRMLKIKPPTLQPVALTCYNIGKYLDEITNAYPDHFDIYNEVIIEKQPRDGELKMIEHFLMSYFTWKGHLVNIIHASRKLGQKD